MAADRSRILRLLPGLLVSAAFTAWFLGRAHWAEVWVAFGGVKVGWVALSAGVLFTEFLIRALRWKILLRPFAPHARFHRLFVATVIGMSLNVVLPFRAGDLARPWLGARETGTSFVPLVTVAVLERIFDLVGLLGVFLLAVLLFPGAEGLVHDDLRERLHLGGLLFGGLGVTGLGAAFWLALRPALSAKVVQGVLRFAPGPVRDRVGGLLGGLTEGLKAVRDPSALASAVGLSLLHWFNGSVSIYLLFHAFSLLLPFGAATFVSVCLAAGVMVPQAPGFFGVFHVAVEGALRLWNLDPAPAQAYAILFWAVSFVPITTLGAYYAVREGFRPAMVGSLTSGR